MVIFNVINVMAEENKIYLTREGLQKLEQEYEELKQSKKLKTKDEAPTTTPSQGLDSEFSTFQEDLSFLESRIEELETILKSYTLISPPPRSYRRIVLIGATVAVEVEGQKDEFTIVGPLEANPMLGKISYESPAGKALLGRKVGDEVNVQSAVTTIYRIKKITYRF